MKAKRAEKEWEKEKGRRVLLSDPDSGSEIGFESSAGKEVRHLLPHISDNSEDCLSFFSQFRNNLKLKQCT